ncbi:MAG: flagellar biosynthetic protein FliQ [Chloroflexota bacterium]
MTEAYIFTLAQQTFTLILMLAAPILLVSLLVGLLVSMFQAATQISEITLTFVPKIVAVALVIALLGGWMAQQLLSYTARLLSELPNLAP